MRPKLVGDIGGTNARLALMSPGTASPRDIGVFQCADFPNLVDAIELYLREQGVAAISEAAIAVGMPVVGDWLEMTNNDWSFSQQALQQKLELDRLIVTNDFTALALAIPQLTETDYLEIGQGNFRANHTIAIIGPGTGLGVSGLLQDERGMRLPIQGEGGHVTLTPRNARERDIVDLLLEQYPHVSAERFLSGPGLGLIYSSLCRLDKHPEQTFTPAQITQRALAEADPQCVETLSIFCAQLGAVSGDLALTLGAEGGVYIGGGIVPKLGNYFAHSDFRSSFESKGRMSGYLADIGTRVITAQYPTLNGVATLLD